MHDEEAVSAKAAAAARTKNMLLIVACVFLVICGASDRIAFKLMVDCMPSYVYFLHQLTMFVYVVAFFVPVVVARELGHITWPLARKFFVMGGLDAVCTLCVILSAPFVPSANQVLFLQGVLPGTMVTSIVFLKKRYSWSHYLGAGTIFAGIIFSAFDSHQSQDKATPTKHPYAWTCLFLAFNIPASLSSVYKEYVFRTAPPDQGISVNVMNFWVSVFQFFWGLAFSPLVVPLQGITWHELPKNFARGGACLFAHKSYDDATVVCSGYTSLVTSLTFFFNITWNVFILLLIKHASAMLMFVANTATIPLASLGFAVPFIVSGGPTPRADVTWQILVSLVVVIAGLVIYQWSPEPTVAGEPEQEPERKPLLINEPFAKDDGYSGSTSARPIAIGPGPQSINNGGGTSYRGSRQDDGGMGERTSSSFIGSPMFSGGFRYKTSTSVSRAAPVPITTGASVERSAALSQGGSARSINGPPKYRQS